MIAGAEMPPFFFIEPFSFTHELILIMHCGRNVPRPAKAEQAGSLPANRRKVLGVLCLSMAVAGCLFTCGVPQWSGSGFNRKALLNYYLGAGGMKEACRIAVQNLTPK